MLNFRKHGTDSVASLSLCLPLGAAPSVTVWAKPWNPLGGFLTNSRRSHYAEPLPQPIGRNPPRGLVSVDFVAFQFLLRFSRIIHGNSRRHGQSPSVRLDSVRPLDQIKDPVPPGYTTNEKNYKSMKNEAFDLHLTWIDHADHSKMFYLYEKIWYDKNILLLNHSWPPRRPMLLFYCHWTDCKKTIKVLSLNE